MNILNSANTAATINKIIHNAQGTTTTTEGATAAGKIIKENLPNIISAGFDMPHPTSVFEGVPPFSFISNGDPLVNWIIYGNTVESASVGERTPNLFMEKLVGISITSNGQLRADDNYDTYIAEVTEGEEYTISNASGGQVYGFFTSKPTLYTYTFDNSRTIFDTATQTTTVPTGENIKYIGVRYNAGVTNAMLNTGDTALPYEPYGYKIPVTCGGVTTNIYIDEPLTAGETISYNDTGVIIPTTMFLNTLSVGTTVQPEKVFIEYVK